MWFRNVYVLFWPVSTRVMAAANGLAFFVWPVMGSPFRYYLTHKTNGYAIHLTIIAMVQGATGRSFVIRTSRWITICGHGRLFPREVCTGESTNFNFSVACVLFVILSGPQE